MADIAEALRRGNGVLSIAEMSRLSGVNRTEIYKILRRCEGKADAPSRKSECRHRPTACRGRTMART
jgi:hypothetical protein